MRIGIDTYNAISQVYQNSKTVSAKKLKDAVSKNDKIEFSQTAKSYQTAKDAVRSADDVRQDKVDQIKALIAAGKYNISSKAVADKILSNASTIAF